MAQVTHYVLRAIVVRGGKDGDLEKRASLLRGDSVHGQFNGSIVVDQERRRSSLMVTSSSYLPTILAEVDYRPDQRCAWLLVVTTLKNFIPLPAQQSGRRKFLFRWNAKMRSEHRIWCESK